MATYIVESDVAMVGLVVVVMLWDKYLRHRIEMTKLKQEAKQLTEKDVLEIIEKSEEPVEEELPKMIKI